MEIYNEDCLSGKIKENTVDLMICDPPFGIQEKSFDKHYKRNSSNVLEGYIEAPKDYDQWTLRWMTEAKRVLKENGSFYVIIGHSNLRSVLNAAHELNLNEINHIIWKFNFASFNW